MLNVWCISAPSRQFLPIFVQSFWLNQHKNLILYNCKNLNKRKQSQNIFHFDKNILKYAFRVWNKLIIISLSQHFFPIKKMLRILNTMHNKFLYPSATGLVLRILICPSCPGASAGMDPPFILKFLQAKCTVYNKSLQK